MSKSKKGDLLVGDCQLLSQAPHLPCPHLHHQLQAVHLHTTTLFTQKTIRNLTTTNNKNRKIVCSNSPTSFLGVCSLSFAHLLTKAELLLLTQVLLLSFHGKDCNLVTQIKLRKERRSRIHSAQLYSKGVELKMFCHHSGSL